MQLLAAINEMYEHNRWARDRQLQACAGLSEQQFSQRLGGSFPSLRETLAHLVAVEWLWLERWRGRSPTALIPPDELPTLAVITERWGSVEREMRSYLEGLDEDALAVPRTYVNIRGERWTYPLWRMIVHLLNHQSYHRGQVTTLLRRLEVEPPRVDFLVGLDAGFAS